MASETIPSKPLQITTSSNDEQRAEELEKELESYISTLPKLVGSVGQDLHLYKGFWYPSILPGVISAEKQFRQLIDRPPRVMLVTYPKSGTTWLKALLFAITTRTQFDCSTHQSTHPLMKSSPHDLVPFLEVYAINNILNPISDASILTTHIPFSLLSDTFKKAHFPIVYVYRNPKDVIVSFWHYWSKISSKELPPLDKEVEMFCKGHSAYGPYYDHLSEYWNASVQMPSRLLFLSYDELRKDPIPLVKRIAEFIGCPFSAAEEQQSLITNIIDLCGFESLSKLEVNKSDKIVIHEKSNVTIKNDAFFRKGEVGDHKNYMSKEMEERVDAMMEEKLRDIKLE